MNPGDKLELRVEQWLTRLIADEQIPVNAALTKVSRHGKVFSRDRGSQITFDVVLELYRRGADTPCLYWIWECKDYSHLVPVDDIEEFHSKIEQIGRDRTKGTIVTTSGFQQSVIALAEAYGIGLVRVVPKAEKASARQSDVTSFDDDDDAIHVREFHSTRPPSQRDVARALDMLGQFLGGGFPSRGNSPQHRPTPRRPPSPQDLLCGSASPIETIVHAFPGSALAVTPDIERILMKALKASLRRKS